MEIQNANNIQNFGFEIAYKKIIGRRPNPSQITNFVSKFQFGILAATTSLESQDLT